MKLRLALIDKNGEIRCEEKADDRVTLLHAGYFCKGDKVELTCESPGFYEVRFEDTMPPAIIYVPNGTAVFQIPFGIKGRIAYSPRSFKGKMHLISAAVANAEMVFARRNLAFNPYDAHGDTGMFPHAVANVETRNETLFAARNAIDGIIANHRHYPYPFQSWGINRDPNAELKIEFGAMADIDSIALVLRADYPHDNYWEKATIEFSDGSCEIISLTKTEKPQPFAIKKNGVESLVLKELIPSSDPSPYPALTQIEVWGRIDNGK